MKKNDNSFAGKVIAALDKLGLTAGELAIVQDYLDSDPRDESILDAITPRDIGIVIEDNIIPMRELIDKTRADKYKGRPEALTALGNIIFSVGESTAAHFFSRYYVYLSSSPAGIFRGLLVDYKHLSMTAEYETLCDIHIRDRNLQRSDIWRCAESYEIYDQALDQAEKHCTLGGKWPMMYIRSLRYYHRFKTGNHNEVMNAEFENEFVPFIIDAFPRAVSGLSNNDAAVLTNYIMSNEHFGTKLDVLTETICKKVNLDLGSRELHLILQSAVLLWQQSAKLARVIRLFTEIDLGVVVPVINDCYESNFACERLCELERAMPFDIDKYILACTDFHVELDSEVKRLYKEKRDKFIGVLEVSTGVEARNLISAIGKANREERRRLTAPGSDYIIKFRDRTARMIAEEMPAGKYELYCFLLGSASAQEIMPFLDGYKSQINRGSSVVARASAFRDIASDDPMNARVDILMLISGVVYSVVSGMKKDGGGYNKSFRANALEDLCSTLDGCGFPLDDQYELMGKIYNECYGDETVTSYLEQLGQVIAERINSNAETAAEIVSSPSAVRLAAAKLFASDPDRYKKWLIAMAGDGSKPVREIIQTVLAGQSEWSKDILALLSSKKSAVRETAIEIISRWDASKYTGQLTAALATEKSQKLRERLEDMLGATPAENKTADKSEDTQPTADDIIARYIKSGKKRSLDWLFAEPMPEVRRSSGDGADTDALQAVMLAYSTMPRPGVSEDAKLIAAELNSADLEAAAREALARWLDSGADAKKKWVLYFASIHGGDAAAQTIISNINQWPLQSRGAIAAEAVNALALSPAPSALMTVDSLSRKCKFKQVKAAAQKALDFAAEQLGITSEQLADRIVPDLGFDAKMSRVFDYGPRSFTVRLTPALDLIITDQTGKRIKNMPAVGQKDDTEIATQSAEQFKLLKKQLKAVIATQKLRLELALSSGRQWTAEAWRQLFVNNPVMRQFAIGLIWGTYDGSKLIDTFRYMEDGSFNTYDEDEYELSESSVIGLVHPIELDKELLEGWKQQLEDYEITQPIEQLGRKVFTLTDEEREVDTLDRFGGIMLNGLSLSGKLLGMGWYRGSVEDGGMYYCYYRENIADGVSAVLRFSGSYVGDQDDTVTVYNALFYKAGTVQYGSYVYDNVKPQDRIKLVGITPRCFSETVLQLEKATASGSDKDENWREDMGARFK